MKKFKTPLAIEGSKEELEALIPELEKLGYVKDPCFDASNPYNKVLVTNCDNIHGNLQYLKYLQYDRTPVKASDKKLVLALAAMVDSDELYEGEWCVYTHYSDGHFIEGCLYQSRKDGWGNSYQFIDEEGDVNGYSVKNRDYFRKATKEEIINHFMKKVKGYKLVKEYPGSATLGTLFFPSIPNRTSWSVENNSPRYYISIEESFFSNTEFFQPVYEEEKKVFKVRYAEGELEVEVKEKKIYFDGKEVSETSIMSLIWTWKVHYGGGSSNNSWVSYPDTVTIGCKKGVVVEDIKKVLESLG